MRAVRSLTQSPLEQNGFLPHPLMSDLENQRCLTYQLLSALIAAIRTESWVQLTARLVKKYIGVYRPDFWIWRLCRRIVASVRRQDRIYEVYNWFSVPGEDLRFVSLDEPVSDLVIDEVERALPTVFHVEDIRDHCHVHSWQTSGSP